MDVTDLAPYIKSKDNIYNILANEGKPFMILKLSLG